MKRIILLAGLVVVAAAGALLWRSATIEKPLRPAAKTEQPAPAADIQDAAPAPEYETATPAPAKTAAKGTQEMPAFSVVIPDEQPPLMVNDRPVTIDDVIPPGVLKPGDSMPEMAHRKFMALAEEQRLLVQEAQEKGLADTPEFLERVADMRKDLEEESNLSDEDKQWRLEHFTRTFLINKLYRQEGLIPERVSNKEVDLYYESQGYEYEWLRKKEALKGSSPEKIERRVRKEIKRDLEAPLKQEIGEKRKAYIESLRERSDIETLE